MKGKIKITFNDTENQIYIVADAEGLKYLSNACLTIIGKDTPGGHFHLSTKMHNLINESIDTIIIYSKMENN